MAQSRGKKEKMTKIMATFVEGKLTKMKDLPSNQELLEEKDLGNFKAKYLLQEVNEVEKQVLVYVRDNFEDLRDFIRKNI
ncbi:Putative uncharacterized protein [Lactococcus lactis subsp. lactis A12]|uniref:Uncharacterized protein n=2 Tax=Lactococcus lactis TaxID=1358 RepID=S6ER09_LACLL|nr:Putative uncharacterized protein [Lactococcus lactis subsp. lactis A12]